MCAACNVISLPATDFYLQRKDFKISEVFRMRYKILHNMCNSFQ
jgi:hypothetical protein